MIATHPRKSSIAIIGLCAALLLATGQSHQKTPAKSFKFSSYRQLENLPKLCDQNTLVIFDVDDTMTTYTDVTQDPRWEPWFEIRAKADHLYTGPDKDKLLWSMLVRQTHYYLFDPDVIAFIRQLQRKQCMVVALTALHSGRYGVIEDLAAWRADGLAELGIHFFGQFDDKTFTTLPQNRGTYPCLHHGILFANGVAKGKVLEAFLDTYKLQPSRVILFDDSTNEHRSIASECARRNIPFTGYQVMGAKRSKIVTAATTTRELPQISFLTRYARWLQEVKDEYIDTPNAYPRHEKHP